MAELSRALLPRLEKAIDAHLETRAREGIGQCAAMSRYHFSTGGKRLRALIPLWVYERCGQPAEAAIPLGAAIEMIHAATLVHDDFQDGDEIRRGKPAVWKKWSPAQAINAGDALFQFAIEAACETNVEGDRLRHVLVRIARGTNQVIEGQAQEFLMKEEPYPRLERYLGVIRGKTGALIATAVCAPLIALGKSPETIAAAENAAFEAGLLFQLQDDLLDLYGDKGRNFRGADIAEGKVSALVASVNEQGSATDRERLAVILAKPREKTSDDEIGEAIAIFERSGARAAVIARVRSIEAGLRDHALGASEPALHALMLDLVSEFLAPVRAILK